MARVSIDLRSWYPRIVELKHQVVPPTLPLSVVERLSPVFIKEREVIYEIIHILYVCVYLMHPLYICIAFTKYLRRFHCLCQFHIYTKRQSIGGKTGRNGVRRIFLPFDVRIVLQ